MPLHADVARRMNTDALAKVSKQILSAQASWAPWALHSCRSATRAWR